MQERKNNYFGPPPETVGKDGLVEFTTHHMKTFGFEEAIAALKILSSLMVWGRKSRIIIDYDPAAIDTKISVFTDAEHARQAAEKVAQDVLDSLQKHQPAQDDR